jgi:hypothetical protein
MRVYLVKKYEEGLKLNPTITIEAEYGDKTVTGSKLTLAHHGENAGNPAPCVYDGDVRIADDDVVVVSHIDLDTLLGYMILRCRLINITKKIGQSVEYIDLNGRHNMHNIPTGHRDLIIAMNDVINSNRLLFTKELVVDITDYIEDLVAKIEDIKIKDIKAAVAKYQELENKIENSLVKEVGNIRVFKSDEFANANYYNPATGAMFDYIINYTKFKTISLSKRDNNIANNMAQIMKEIFGEGAGGRENIAGSPRDMQIENPDKYIEEIIKRLA